MKWSKLYYYKNIYLSSFEIKIKDRIINNPIICEIIKIKLL